MDQNNQQASSGVVTGTNGLSLAEHDRELLTNDFQDSNDSRPTPTRQNEERRPEKQCRDKEQCNEQDREESDQPDDRTLVEKATDVLKDAAETVTSTLSSAAEMVGLTSAAEKVGLIKTTEATDAE